MDWEEQRNKIIGLGDDSFKKSYYPELQSKINELEVVNLNLNTIFNSTSDAIIIHNEAGEILQCNSPALSLFNIQEDEFLNRNLNEFFNTQKDISEIINYWKQALQGVPQIFEWIINANNSKEDIVVQISLNKVNWYNKNVLVAVMRDFSERIRYEKQLIKAKEKAKKSEKLKTQFLNNLSHEIRTPLNGILGFSDLIVDQDISLKNRTRYSEIIHNNSHQLLKIIDDLLELSMLELDQIDVKNTNVSLNSFVDELFSKFESKYIEKHIELFVNKESSEDVKIQIDELKLFKIMNNLIENAFKYTNTGRIDIGYKILDDKINLFVKDTGIGIDKKNYDLVFESFSQEEKDLSQISDGLGLGLSIAKETAHLLGAEIVLNSEKGRGSEFILQLLNTSIK